MNTRIKRLQDAKPLIDEQFDDMQFVVDLDDPDSTLKLAGKDLREKIGRQPHTHPLDQVNGLPGELAAKFDKKGGTITGDVDVTGSIRAKALKVDEYLEVPELKYNRITATGIEMWITDGAVVDEVFEDNDGVFLVTLKKQEGEIPVIFQHKDILRGKFYIANPDGTEGGYMYAFFEVTGVIDDTRFDCIPLNGVSPRKFMTLVRQGNKNEPKRQGSIYLDGIDKTIKVLDGVRDERIGPENVKIQIGKLDGFRHPVHGELDGYSGYFDNVFICGRLVQRDPDTGKEWEIGSVAVSGENVFHYDENEKVSPATITLTATENGFTSKPEQRQWQYKKGNAWNIITGANGLSYTLSPGAAIWSGNTVTIRYIVSGIYEDIITVTKVRNGKIGQDGKDGTTGPQGKPGATGPQGPQGPEGPQGPKGDRGTAGSKGADGKTPYWHIKFSNDGGKTFTANNGETPGEWMGEYVDFVELDSTDANKYTWIKIKGDQGQKGNTGAKGDKGTPGPAGADGKTPYLHIKFSNDGGKTFTANNGEDPGDWMGEYVDFVELDSNDPKKYTWAKVKGEPGQKGDKGNTGATGAQGPKGDKGNTGATGAQGPKGDKGNTGATGPQGPKGDKGETGDSITGKMIYRDPEFRKGINSVIKYNNGKNAAGNNTDVTVSRITRPADCPTTSTHAVEITVKGTGTSPGLGGFYQGLQSRPNAVFIQKIVAKIPVGFRIATASNSMGSGYTDRFITPVDGTGKYETYIRKVICGPSGTFSTGGHVYILRSTGTIQYPLKWQVASCTAYDLTDSEYLDDILNDLAEQAKAPRAVLFRGVFSPTVKYYNNINRRDIVKYSNTHYIYKGKDATAGAWAAANWQVFGGEFSSVATDILFTKLAYIENLGVKNLKTNLSGQRLEITEVDNRLAFYNENATQPIIEIKSTNDPLYNGKKAGLYVNQGTSAMSITHGFYQRGGNGKEILGLGSWVPHLSEYSLGTQNAIYSHFDDQLQKRISAGLAIRTTNTSNSTRKEDSDYAVGLYVAKGGIYIDGEKHENRHNNVLSGVRAAGRVSESGVLTHAWTCTNNGNTAYLTVSRRSTGIYRITFAKSGFSGFAHVLLSTDTPRSGSTNVGCTCTVIKRVGNYMEVFTGVGATAYNCGFSFIVLDNMIFYY